MQKKYTLSYLYELRDKVNKLRYLYDNMLDLTVREELEQLEKELEIVTRSIMWDIENGELDYGDRGYNKIKYKY